MLGLFKDDKFIFCLVDMLWILWIIYFLLGIVCIVCYRFVGMFLFDVICYGIFIVLFGGFLIYSESIGYFNNYLVELVVGFFFLLLVFNFIFWYIVISRKMIKFLIRDIEFCFFLLIVLGVIIVIFFQVWYIGMYDLYGSFIYLFFFVSFMFIDNGLVM